MNSEQPEVLKVIETDLNAYLARDKETWERTWVHGEVFQSIMECGMLQVANGQELTEIAKRLSVTLNTVKTHLKRTFEKVGVNSQAELLRWLVSLSV